MEPLSARGLPRLSWIDTLYSSMYPSVPLFTPRPHIASHLSPLYPNAVLPSNPPPSSSSTSHGLPVCVTATLISPLVLQLVGITVAVHNKTVNPPTLSTRSPARHLRTPWRHSLLSVVVVGVLFYLFLRLANGRREPGKSRENVARASESYYRPGGGTLCSDLSRTQAV